jgi:aryl carrier-like protein
MLVMAECHDAEKRIKCILFRQKFRSRKEELLHAIRRMEGACDDVKMSLKLKKVLKVILKVGNQLNDEEELIGFTVDSLVMLQYQKAFDKKTSILQYIVRLVSRNDEACLLFPEEDLVHLTESETLSMDQILSEMSLLSSSHQSCKEILNEINLQEGGGGKETKSMADFLNQVSFFTLPPIFHSLTAQVGQQLEDISDSIDVIRTKYRSVLTYFGYSAETSLPSHEFFSTLEKFVKVTSSPPPPLLLSFTSPTSPLPQAFIEERERNEQLRKVEELKAQAEKGLEPSSSKSLHQQPQNRSRGGNRRSSSFM